jgi:aspartyl-tRNA(Asn)/glutamyl-tRNA(Gln) amidotransferase subunit A
LTNLADLTVTELLDEYRSGRSTPRDAVEACLGRMGRLESTIHAVLTLLIDRSLEAADEATRRWEDGTARALEGIPYGLKDIISTAGVRTTGGSPVYSDLYPDRDATCVARLQDAGAIMVAKLQTFEFASGVNSVTNNPWDPAKWPCGSSSGSAAAVSARELPLAIGTDTGGSVVVPSGFCGVTGMKPTYGRVSRFGVMPLSWTLDHVGPIARSAFDCALALSVMAGEDAHDPHSAVAPVPDFAQGIDAPPNGLRVGIATDWFTEVCDPEIAAATRRAAEVLENAGAHLGEFAMPSMKVVNLHAMEMTIIYAELASLHASHMDRIGKYGEGFSALMARAQFTSAVDYLQALRARTLIQRDFEAAFARFDVVLVPCNVTTAPYNDHLVSLIGEVEYPFADVHDRCTSIMNMTGIPTIAVPSGFDRFGMPMSVQFAARPYDEATALRAAHAFQTLTDHHRAVPPVVRAVDDRLDGSFDGAGVVELEVESTLLDRVW